MSKIKIALVDDHTIVREGFKILLNSSDKMEVVAEAGSGAEAQEIILNADIDVLILDVYMPDMNGIELCEKLKNQGIKTPPVLFLSMHNNKEYFVNAINVGASGFLLKDCEKEELFLAVSKIAEGDTYFANTVSNSLIKSLLDSKTNKLDKSEMSLTQREKEILTLALDGLTAKAIGEKLFISARTVDKHRANIMNKFNVHSIVELINFVRKNNIL